MNETTGTAQKIIDKIFEEANRVIQMNITTMSEIGIASVLTGLVGFFVAGYRNDYDLSQELTPQFQKRIMPRVDKTSYENYTFQLNDAYTKFREVAIDHQYKSENWASEMFEEFGSMLLEMLNANATQYSKNLMIEAAKRLLDIATKTVAPTTDTVRKSYNSSTVNEEKKEKKSGKAVKIIIGILVAIFIIFYFYKDNVHHQVHPEGMYFMQEYLNDSGEHYDCYIKIISEEVDGKTKDFFNIYLIYYADDSGEYLPYYCYMMSAPCGYWEWKKLIGGFSVNNAGEKYGIIQKGYQRIDCYIAEGKSVGFDSNFELIDTSEDDLSAMVETIDFGTNNFVYQGTIYNKVYESNLGEDTKLYIEILEEMMDEAE